MTETTSAPSICLTIGSVSRVLHAYVTTEPPDLDAPSTVTLYNGPLKDVVLLANEPCVFDAARDQRQRGLILVETTELGWQRMRNRSHGHRLTPADPQLVGLATLQRWLWNRIVGQSLERHRQRPCQRTKRVVH